MAKAFAFKPGELAALQSAQRRFLSWYADLPSHNRQRFTALGNAAREFRVALQPFLDHAHLNPDAAALLVILQQTELHQRTVDYYRRALVEVDCLTQLLSTVAAAVVTPGKTPDERVYAWVCMAADDWTAAGGKATSRGRFANALREFVRDPMVPAVGGEDQIRSALDAWRAVRQGGQLAPNSPPALREHTPEK